MREILCWCALMLLLSGTLWAIPKTRRMPGIFMTGWKTVPVGCSLVALTPIAVAMSMWWYSFSIHPNLDVLFILAIPFVLIPLGIVSGVLAVIGLYRLLRRHFQAEADPMGFAAVGLFVILSALAFHILSHYFELEGSLY